MRGRPLAVLAALVALLLAAGVAGAVLTGGTSRGPVGAAAGGAGSAPPGARPASVSLPPPLPGAAPVPDPARLARVLAPALAAPALGGGPAAVVVDAASGRSLLARRADAPVVPASTAKLATAAAALTTLGPAATLATRVVVGRAPGEVILVGGGDPTLASTVAPGYPRPAGLDVLAARTAAALRAAGVRTVTRLGYDAGRFAGPASAPGWKPSYVTEGVVAPVSALAVDEGRLVPDGRARAGDPAEAAAVAFADRLRRHGVVVTGTPGPGRGGGRTLAEVRSPPVAALVERMLLASDNDLAEALARQVAIAAGRPATFGGAAAAVHDALDRLGLGDGIALVDGSGLSRSDRVTAGALAAILRAAAGGADARLRTIATALPVAGFAGTLADRYGAAPAAAAAGAVRAKTGTLFHVSALAGFTVDADRRLLVFAFVADRVPSTDPLAAEAALDDAAAVLTACGCR